MVEQSLTKGLSIIIPIGIPALGKSYLVNLLQKQAISQGINFKIVSSDVIRKTCMDNLMKKKPDTKKDDAFNSTGKEAGKLFMSTVEGALKEGCIDFDTKKTVVYLDKNHPPNAFRGIFETISKVEGQFGR